MQVQSQKSAVRCRLKELREAHKLTQEEVAVYIGVQTAAVSKYEASQRNIPIPKIFKLMDLFHCPFEVLYERQ